ncbi:TIGR03617 family F420-dependent LLM class oxidoreductase [Mycobacterium sp. Y57]|uniref:TIGR03617 family F420-dependent LLM class oxidoreductase n=1 Tax=Mycolicibacterium xanthum TaxID=2796469 RepID=UPI001C85C05E|nr:TIGR03617 family F420-dependent LLM class oxidoreductase [Mycolicibacterium xanthum]MBX7434712.1 TIGR03617 family F420-dependent LLM class oxidoreductase [Mycolicibacterium xanthum]
MKAYLAFDPVLPLSAVPAYAQRAERLGFDGVHVPETVHDSLAVALLAVEHTEWIVVRTAVTLALVRSPTLVAYAAWDLAAMSGGRFELGLGSQIRQNIEDRYGMAWSEPVSMMGDYVAALKAIFETFATGAPLHYTGSHYRLTRMQPYFNPGPNGVAVPRIWLGAVNERMCRIAGELCTGVVTHTTNSEPEYLRDVVLPALAQGAGKAGHGRRPLLVAAPAIATGGSDEAVARDRERHRRMLAFLYTTPAYGPALKRKGWSDLPDVLRELVRTQRWQDLSTALPDDILDQLVIAGTYEQLPAMLSGRFGGIADGIVLPPLGDERDDDLIAGCVAGIRATSL